VDDVESPPDETVTVIGYSPADDGTPLNEPWLDSETPVGRPVAEKEYDPGPPLAVRLAEYGPVVDARGNTGVVIPSTVNDTPIDAVCAGDSASTAWMVKL
jgi:hypothetical protein